MPFLSQFKNKIPFCHLTNYQAKAKFTFQNPEYNVLQVCEYIYIHQYTFFNKPDAKVPKL